MRESTHCKLIGKPTGGGSAFCTESHIIVGDDTYVLRIPTRRLILNGEAVPIETTKIVPDVYYTANDIVHFAIRYTKAETYNPDIQITYASLDQESNRVRRTIRKMGTYTALNVRVKLPEPYGPNSTADTETALTYVSESYDPTYYTAGMDKIQRNLPIIQHATEVLSGYQNMWGFGLPENINIILTRYGTAGSYETKTNTVWVRVSEDGTFPRNNPSATAIHEITHLLIEHVVQTQQLTFSEKEKLVAGVDTTLFPEIFSPEGNVADSKQELNLTRLTDLSALVAEYRKNKPQSG